MKLKLGENYSAVGYSGLTDGAIVEGRLTEYNQPHNHAVLICSKTNKHCAVIYRTLKKVK